MTRIVVAPPPRPAAPRPAQALDLPPSARALGLVREEDLGWIGALVAVVVQLEAQPWRLALDVIDSGEWLRAWRAAGERDVPRGERDVSGGERDMPSARR